MSFKSRGEIVQHTAAADIAVDEVVVMGDSVGIAAVAILTGEEGSVEVAGRHEVAKVAGTAWVQGDKLDWDASESAFEKGLTPAAGDVTGCAYAAADAGSADTTAEVILANPGTIN